LEKKAPVFLREATGLRKSISPIDAFGLNTLTVNIGLGILFLAFLAPTSFPGGDMVFATILTIIGCVIFALAWSFVAAAMPRLGGDYVYVSRIVHPLLGVISNWGVVLFGWLFDVVAIYILVADSLSPSFYALGYLMNNSALTSLAGSVSGNTSVFLIGTATITLLSLIVFLGTRYFVYVIRICWVVGIIGAAAALIAFLGVSPQQFAANVNAYAQSAIGVSNYYSSVLSGGSAGFAPVQPFSLQTVMIIPFVFFELGFFFYSSYIGVELKNVQKAQIYGMVLSVLVCGIFTALLAWAFENTATYNFIYASTNLYFTNATAYALPAPPYINFFAMIGSGNVVLSLLIMIGFICWGIIWTGVGTFYPPRNMMAWSFDHLGPSFLAQVHERFNTPHWGILVAAIGHYLLFALTFVAGSFILGLSATVGNLLFTFIPMAIAAIIFPYASRSKEIFEQSPGLIKRKFGGIPIIVVLGIVSLVFLIMNVYFFLGNSAYGANSAPSLAVIVGAFVFATLWYFIWKYYRKSQGIDVALAYRQIPPE